jgi:hypothetical protein
MKTRSKVFSKVSLLSAKTLLANTRLKLGPHEYRLAALVTCNRGFCYGGASYCHGSMAIKRAGQVSLAMTVRGAAHGISRDLGNRHRC